MTDRASRLVFRGTVEYRHEANPKLDQPGVAVLVSRGVNRSLAMACPDGCGEQLTINLDKRSGPSWRYYGTESGITLFPSVWRDTGCKSHFIIWRSRIYWCDLGDELESVDSHLLNAVREKLPRNFIRYVDLADQMGLEPWAVLSACVALCRRQAAVRGKARAADQFRSL